MKSSATTFEGVSARDTGSSRGDVDAARRGHAGPGEDGAARAESGPRVLFVQKGEFSGSNQGLQDGLRQVYPDLRLDVLDIRAELAARKPLVARLLWQSLRERGLLTHKAWADEIRSRFALRDHIRINFAHSRAVFDAVRDIVRARTAHARYDLTFQTQSLFDASTPGIPHFVYTDHAALARSDAPEDAQPDPDWLAREEEIYRNAARIFTFGPHVRDVLIERYGTPVDKVTTVGTGIQAAVSAPVNTDVERYRGKRILFVGRAWERKGGSDLLAAFRIARETVPDARLIVVGTDTPSEEPGVTVLGSLPPEEVAAEFARASLFCMPSRLEPFGIVVAEAMHHGLPVVSTRVGEMKSMIEHGTNGLLVAPRAPEALARALVRLLQDPELSASFARHGLCRAERYSWSFVAKEMARYFPDANL